MAVDSRALTPQSLVALQPLLAVDGDGVEASTPLATPDAVTPEDILKVLDVPDGEEEDVLEQVTKRSNSLIQIKVSAGRWSSRLMEMSRSTTWLRAPRWTSDLVLVDAHYGSAAPDKASPISAICAALVNTPLDPVDYMSILLRPQMSESCTAFVDSISNLRIR